MLEHIKVVKALSPRDPRPGIHLFVHTHTHNSATYVKPLAAPSVLPALNLNLMPTHTL